MMLQVIRFSSQSEDTLGLLFDVTDPMDRKFLCYTLEDEYRTKKKHGETRIPCGTYPVKLRTEGGFHTRYAKKFAFHEGMLHVQDVPGFQWILIHIGNDDDDTAGCLLLGDEQRQNVNQPGFIMKSTAAYKRVYRHVLEAFDRGEEVFIMYVDLDSPEPKGD